VEVGAVGKIAGVVVLGAVLASACGPRGVYHRVKPGETLSLIGRAYGVGYRRIASANDIDDPERIYAGQRILIPGARRAIDQPLVEAPVIAARRSASRSRPADAPDLAWPIDEAPVTSLFGPRGSRFHDGIDIGAAVGSTIRAAAGGEVVFDGVLSGYGKIIIVRHAAGYSTVYAHNRRHHVAKGQWVRRGQRIAEVGRTGRVTGPNLHFEIRHDNQARDPMVFLPPRGRAALDGSRRSAVGDRRAPES
jgi:lipoprotein NlpD